MFNQMKEPTHIRVTFGDNPVIWKTFILSGQISYDEPICGVSLF